MTTHEKLSQHKDEALRKALDNLARYKFNNFGYWAAIWVHLNQINGKEPNPFRPLVDLARNMQQAAQEITNPDNSEKPLSKTGVETPSDYLGHGKAPNNARKPSKNAT